MTSMHVVESDALELALRSILRIFANGNLVYRKREIAVAIDVDRLARRVRQLRAGGVA